MNDITGTIIGLLILGVCFGIYRIYVAAREKKGATISEAEEVVIKIVIVIVVLLVILWGCLG